MRTTSHKVSPRSATHSLTIPAALAGSLPAKCVWEIEVTSTGYALHFICESSAKPRKAVKVDLPFLPSTGAMGRAERFAATGDPEVLLEDMPSDYDLARDRERGK